MKLILAITTLAFASPGLGEIVHDNEFSPKDATAWEARGHGYDGDYTSLDGDHTGSSSVHIRRFGERGILYLWLTIITQEDAAVVPTIQTFPKYEQTRTKGTFKAHDKVEYIKFVDFKGTKGVLIGGRFYKLQR